MPPYAAFSPAAKTHRAEREAHVAELQRFQWRVGVVDGRWCVAQYDGLSWRTLPDTLEHFADIDVVAERRRLVSWLHELLGYRSGFLDVDYAAAEQGRMAFALIINS